MVRTDSDEVQLEVLGRIRISLSISGRNFVTCYFLDSFHRIMN